MGVVLETQEETHPQCSVQQSPSLPRALAGGLLCVNLWVVEVTVSVTRCPHSTGNSPSSELELSQEELSWSGGSAGSNELAQLEAASPAFKVPVRKK